MCQFCIEFLCAHALLALQSDLVINVLSLSATYSHIHNTRYLVLLIMAYHVVRGRKVSALLIFLLTHTVSQFIFGEKRPL